MEREADKVKEGESLFIKSLLASLLQVFCLLLALLGLVSDVRETQSSLWFYNQLKKQKQNNMKAIYFHSFGIIFANNE